MPVFHSLLSKRECEGDSWLEVIDVLFHFLSIFSNFREIFISEIPHDLIDVLHALLKGCIELFWFNF